MPLKNELFLVHDSFSFLVVFFLFSSPHFFSNSIDTPRIVSPKSEKPIETDEQTDYVEHETPSTGLVLTFVFDHCTTIDSHHCLCVCGFDCTIVLHLCKTRAHIHVLAEHLV